MLLILKEAIKRHHSDLEFFQCAYLWRFKKETDVFGDVLAYRTQNTIPQYVREYLKHVYDL